MLKLLDVISTCLMVMWSKSVTSRAEETSRTLCAMTTSVPATTKGCQEEEISQRKGKKACKKTCKKGDGRGCRDCGGYFILSKISDIEWRDSDSRRLRQVQGGANGA